MVYSIVGCRLAIETFVVVHPAIVIVFLDLRAVLHSSSWQLASYLSFFLFLVRHSISLTPGEKMTKLSCNAEKRNQTIQCDITRLYPKPRFYLYVDIWFPVP
jgi:hypothetical protein